MYIDVEAKSDDCSLELWELYLQGLKLSNEDAKREYYPFLQEPVDRSE